MVLLISLLWAGSGWAAEFVMVFESTAPDVAVGDKLDVNVDVNLEFGQRLQVWDRNGVSYMLVGPYSGPPLVADKRASGSFREQTRKALNQLIGKGLVEQNNLGGIRGPSTLSSGNEPPNVWLLPLGVSLVHCVRDNIATDEDATIAFWDPTATAGPVEVRSIAGGASATASWRSGAATTPWPTEVGIIHDGIYLIRSEAGSRSSAVQTRLVPGTLPEDHRMAFWLATEGCIQQARQIARTAGES